MTFFRFVTPRQISDWFRLKDPTAEEYQLPPQLIWGQCEWYLKRPNEGSIYYLPSPQTVLPFVEDDSRVEPE